MDFRRLLPLPLLILAVLVASPAKAQSPIQLALVAPSLQLVPEGEAVKGLRLSVYGSNAAMTGLDIGLVSRTRGAFEGVQWGFIGLNQGATTGVQFNTVNVTEGLMKGIQFGLVNAATTAEGFQWGAFNHSRNYRGLQLALVNYAETMDGVQVGLINIIREGGVLPVMPLVNWSFD